MASDEVRRVVFVCPHGAGKSRVAAALFDAVASGGWRASSAGLQPQDEVSEHASRLLAGDPAAGLLDGSAPRRLDEVSAEVVVAIDCEIPDARRWLLVGPWPSEAVCAELRELTGVLAAELAGSVDRAR